MTYTNDDWLTPPEILQRLGRFDLDPCASTRRPWPTADRHFTIDDDGLSKEWHGRVWLNPPYTEVSRWMARMHAHGNGISLANARTETRWFFDYVWSADAVLFIRGRVTFFRPDGTKGDLGGRASNPSVLIAFSNDDSEALYRSGISGKFIPLKIKLPVNIRRTWKQLVIHYLNELGGVATLDQLYEILADHPKARGNPNYEAKIRQQVQRVGRRVGPGLWQANLFT